MMIDGVSLLVSQYFQNFSVWEDRVIVGSLGGASLHGLLFVFKKLFSCTSSSLFTVPSKDRYFGSIKGDLRVWSINCHFRWFVRLICLSSSVSPWTGFRFCLRPKIKPQRRNLQFPSINLLLLLHLMSSSFIQFRTLDLVTHIKYKLWFIFLEQQEIYIIVIFEKCGLLSSGEAKPSVILSSPTSNSYPSEEWDFLIIIPSLLLPLTN